MATRVRSIRPGGSRAYKYFTTLDLEQDNEKDNHFEYCKKVLMIVLPSFGLHMKSDLNWLLMKEGLLEGNQTGVPPGSSRSNQFHRYVPGIQGRSTEVTVGDVSLHD